MYVHVSFISVPKIMDERFAIKHFCLKVNLMNNLSG